MAAEPDEYQVATLVGGFPLCVFRPKPYSRKITNIVITNGASGEVRCYRGTLNSIAVARNSKGDSNTIGGGVKVPAGQLFFVQWQNAGTPVTSATARVSWNRVEGNFDEGDSVVWSEESIGRIVVPSDGETDPSLPPYIIIANDNNQAGTDFASVIFRTPTLPANWEYRIQVRKAPPPFEAQFEIVLWDTVADDQVSRLLTQNYNSGLDDINTVLGPRWDDPAHSQATYVWAHDFLQIMTQHPADTGILEIRSNLITFAGQSLPLASDLAQVEFGPFNANPPELIVQNRTLGFSHINVNQTPPPATTTVAAAFGLIVGATTAIFRKDYVDTETLLTMGMGLFSTAGGTTFEYGLRVTPNPHTGVGTLDIRMGQGLLSLANVELAPSSTYTESLVGGAWLVGLYTLAPIWRRTGGGGTLTITAVSGTISYTAQEMQEN